MIRLSSLASPETLARNAERRAEEAQAPAPIIDADRPLPTGPRIFGDWFDDAAWARARRDGIPPLSLVRVLFYLKPEHGYLVRAYGHSDMSKMRILRRRSDGRISGALRVGPERIACVVPSIGLNARAFPDGERVVGARDGARDTGVVMRTHWDAAPATELVVVRWSGGLVSAVRPSAIMLAKFAEG